MPVSASVFFIVKNSAPVGRGTVVDGGGGICYSYPPHHSVVHPLQVSPTKHKCVLWAPMEGNYLSNDTG